MRSILAHPLTRGLDVNDPRTTTARRRIIREKPFLRRLYEDWYRTIVAKLPAGNAPVAELGSGAGFLADFLPGLITSEVFACPEISIVLDARRLPFRSGALRGIVMTDVLHHIPDPSAFFAEASRTLMAGGRIVMVEPWVTAWSRLVYTHLHSEPFEPDAATWEFPQTGPLSGANGAMPWMIFERDRTTFGHRFPLFEITEISPMMPFSYLASGGVSMRSLAPGWSYPLWRAFERAIAPANRHLAMFALITLQRRA